MTRNIQYFTDLSDLAEKTRCYLELPTVALSGGSTFAALFPFWIALNPQGSETVFFPVDERMVPFDDPQSNWGTASRLFLDPMKRSADKNHHPRSAEQYTAILKERFPGPVPCFDTIFLGVGDDGHTASLFPGQPELFDLESIVLQTRSPKPPHERLTLAPAVIRAARNLIMIIAGTGKKHIVQRLIEGDTELPCSIMLSLHNEPVIFIEEQLA